MRLGSSFVSLLSPFDVVVWRRRRRRRRRGRRLAVDRYLRWRAPVERLNQRPAVGFAFKVNRRADAAAATPAPSAGAQRNYVHPPPWPSTLLSSSARFLNHNFFFESRAVSFVFL